MLRLCRGGFAKSIPTAAHEFVPLIMGDRAKLLGER
jgi:hypothetical protein